jgi:hypothetical protein
MSPLIKLFQLSKDLPQYVATIVVIQSVLFFRS